MTGVMEADLFAIKVIYCFSTQVFLSIKFGIKKAQCKITVCVCGLAFVIRDSCWLLYFDGPF